MRSFPRLLTALVTSDSRLWLSANVYDLELCILWELGGLHVIFYA